MRAITFFGTSILMLIAAVPSLAGTDELRVRAAAGTAPGVTSLVSDTDGNGTDGVATKGIIFIDYTIPGTRFRSGVSVGSVHLGLAAVAGGASLTIYPVAVTIGEMGGGSVVLDIPEPATVSVARPSSVPSAAPENVNVPVGLTSDAAKLADLAACDGIIPPDPLVQTISFSNPTSGRHRLANGPNVKVRVTLSCREEETVFCTVSQGCLGQPGGQPGDDIAFCNDPLAGWLTLNADAVLPMTVGGAHLLHGPLLVAGYCGSSAYDDPVHDGKGSGIGFQTLCGQTGVIAYLPSGTRPGILETYKGSNREISAVGDILLSDRHAGGSRGSGGGVLTGQALTLKLGVALSKTGRGPYVAAGSGSCVEEFGRYVCGTGAENATADCSTGGAPDDTKCYGRAAFVPGDVGHVQLPNPETGPVELCTQRSGDDVILEATGVCGPARCEAGLCSASSANAGTACLADSDCIPPSDDVCAVFTFPACVAGRTVGEILQAAEETLSGGASALCGGDPALLSSVLDLVNRAFDGCGKVIDCASASGAGEAVPGGTSADTPKSQGEGGSRRGPRIDHGWGRGR